MIDWTPPDPDSPATAELGRLAGLGAAQRATAAGLRALYLFATSATQYLAEHFESEQVRAALGWHAINDSTGGPSTPGTAFVLLHDHASEQAGGGIRSWGFVRGGMAGSPRRWPTRPARPGRRSAPGLRSSGSSSRTAAPRASSWRAAPVRAARVLSNADPKRRSCGWWTNGAAAGRFRAAIEAYRCEGTSMKINLAVDRLPVVAAVDGDGVQPYHRGIMELNPTVAEMDAGPGRGPAGRPAADPHIELCIPTVHDPSLAPDGRHVVTIDVNSQPYTLAEGYLGRRSATRSPTACVAKLDGYFPELDRTRSSSARCSPRTDLESRLGIWGGHALHGDMAFDQLFDLRPVRGWADYRTPVRDLYLCGAGTHPGGGVTGANGRNCAREVIRDHRGLAAKLRGARR